jgi:hypothetical protein
MILAFCPLQDHKDKSQKLPIIGFLDPAQPMIFLRLNHSIQQKLGNFPSPMGCFRGLVRHILAPCR